MELERRSDVGGRINKTCLKVLTKELSALSSSPQYGALFSDFRRNNGLRSEDLSRFDSGALYTTSTSNAIRGTYQLKGMLEILGILTTELSKLHEETKSRIEPLGRSIGQILEGMPIELLALTMRDACTSVQDVVIISHVNHRFRCAARGLMDLCTDITPSLSPGCLVASLGWSGNVGLNIQISQYQCIPHNEHEIPMQPYLDKILPHSQRWKSLELLSADKDFLKDPSGFLQVQERIVGLDLPNLQKLQYTYMRGYSRNLEVAGDINTSKHIYLTWNAPNLREVSFRKIVPHPFSHSITNLTLELPERERDDRELNLHLNDVHSFLQISPSIETLCLISRIKIREGHLATFPKLAMNNLREVDVRCVYGALQASPGHPVISFVQSLEAPNLTSASLQAHLAQHGGFSNGGETEVNISDVVFGLMPKPSWPRIRKLKVTVISDAFNAHPILHIPFRRLSALEELSILFGGEWNIITLEKEETPAHQFDFPPVKQLLLYGCTNGGLPLLRDVSRAAAERGDGDKLSVTIQYSSSVQESDALNLVPAERLCYSDAR